MQWKTSMLVLPDSRHLRFGDAVQRNILSAWFAFLGTGRDEHSQDVHFSYLEELGGAPVTVKVANPDRDAWVPLRVEVSSSRSPSRPFLLFLKGDGVVESFFLPSALSAIPPGAVAAIFSVDRRLRTPVSREEDRTALTPPHDLSLPPSHWLVASVHSS